MIEAALMLLVALVLVRHVRFARWSRLIVGKATTTGSRECIARSIAIAMTRAERHLLRRPLKCLPRAMAAHWMLQRRGIASRLVIGGSRPGTGLGEVRPRAFHAWIECAGAAVDMGRRDADGFVPIMVLGGR